jgi:hypothetical protein
VLPEAYLAFDYGESIGGEGGELGIALDSIKIKGSFSVASSILGDKVTFTIIYRDDLSPSMTSEQTEADQQSVYPSHSTDLLGENIRGISFNAFPIESITKTQSVVSSEQLFTAAEAGLKPVPVAGSDAERIYGEAKTVLRGIITDDMTDVEKLHAIYDWIIYNVTYDKDVLDIYIADPDSEELRKYNCFYLEGVFDDKIAVCDGFAKAFALLARIEGIEAIKISGVSRNSSNQLVNHAWNKVCLSGNWYVVDSTWGNFSSGETKEYMTHAYFLVPDMELYDSHKETDSYVAAASSYEYYKNAEEGDLYVDNETEFDQIYSSLWASQHCIEVYNASDRTNSQLTGGYLGVSCYYIGNVILMYQN